MTHVSHARSIEAENLESASGEDENRLSKRVRAFIRITGLVQGVGFRPFVFRVASRLGLSGLVRNTSGGVEIEAEGSPEQVEALIGTVQAEPPPIARIHRVEVSPLTPLKDSGFRIVPSESQAEEAALVSPDVATCAECLHELRDPSDRRHHYPFINCTNCGPRFSIVQGVPYDRALTTMRGFTLCETCSQEYTDPLDRRFHAEPNACPACGPKVELWDASGRCLEEDGRAIAAARRELARGRILAVKGLGGFHLACDATDSEAVARLRRRKGRPHKPLAIMCRDLSVVRRYCLVSDAEARELSGPSRPILLLDRHDRPAPGSPPVSPALAPGRDDLGVMLPYTPLHHLLLEEGGPACLVMTSGNRSEEPIVIENRAAIHTLGEIADSYLVHNRPIWNRCDDSVGFVEGQRLALMRRSRGFAPLPIDLPRPVEPTLAVGAMYSNTFALAAGRRLFFSQHIGDVDNQETLAFLRESIEKLCSWLGIRPKVIVHDLHPDLLTTRLARELVGQFHRVAVQHHHAHFAAALAAAGFHGNAQGLVLDGTGWGTDRTFWGGELLVGTAAGVRRAGHLRPLPLPGGEAAIRRPLRLAVAYLHALMPTAARAPLDIWRRAGPREVSTVRRMVDRNFNTPVTSSAGRLFDAVSALLGLRDEITYEGQAAIELEQVARRGNASRGPLLFLEVKEQDGRLVIDPAPLVCGLVEARLNGTDAADLAAGFHSALAESMALACQRVRWSGGPQTVVLCGGVFQNRMLTRLTARALVRLGLEPILPGPIPVNDAGIALGQVLVAAEGAPAPAEG